MSTMFTMSFALRHFPPHPYLTFTMFSSSFHDQWNRRIGSIGNDELQWPNDFRRRFLRRHIICHSWSTARQRWWWHPLHLQQPLAVIQVDDPLHYIPIYCVGPRYMALYCIMAVTLHFIFYLCYIILHYVTSASFYATLRYIALWHGCSTLC